MSNSVGSVNAVDSVFSSTLAKDIPFNFVNGVLTLFVGDKQYSIGKEDARIGEIKTILNDPLKTVVDLEAVLNKNSVERHINECPANTGKAYVKDGEVYFNGELINSVLAQRIKECLAFGLSFEHMLRFMENIAANPSYRSQTELFDFLGNKSLPVTPDGCFLGYKAVRNDWMDKYSGTIFNGIGTKVSIPRNKVDDAREHECSFGLHVGALPYVQNYGNGSTDRIIYVKVNPKDVVAVPADHNAQKVRVCEYEVIGEYKGELNQSPVYSNDITPQGSPVNATDDWDDNWDDDDYDDEDDFEPTIYDDYYGDDNYWDDEDEDDEDEDELDDEFADKTDEYGCGVYQSPPPDKKYGVKPSGQRYYDVRENGRFVKK